VVESEEVSFRFFSVRRGCTPRSFRDVEVAESRDVVGATRLCPSALSQRLEQVQWVHERAGFAWEARPHCLEAAVSGNLEVLKWLREEGCPWHEDLCNEAGEKVVKWAVRNGCPFRISEIKQAVHNNYFGAAKIMYKLMMAAKPHEIERVEEYYACTVHCGNLRMLKWLRERGFPWDTTTSAGAVDNLFVLKWLKEKGCPWDETTCTAAALAGNLPALKWAREQGCAWDESTCVAHQGHLEVLKWLREEGCPWDQTTGKVAVLSRNKELVLWLFTNKYPWREQLSKDELVIRANIRANVSSGNADEEEEENEGDEEEEEEEEDEEDEEDQKRVTRLATIQAVYLLNSLHGRHK